MHEKPKRMRAPRCAVHRRASRVFRHKRGDNSHTVMLFGISELHKALIEHIQQLHDSKLQRIKLSKRFI